MKVLVVYRYSIVVDCTVVTTFILIVNVIFYCTIKILNS